MLWPLDGLCGSDRGPVDEMQETSSIDHQTEYTLNVPPGRQPQWGTVLLTYSPHYYNSFYTCKSTWKTNMCNFINRH